MEKEQRKQLKQELFSRDPALAQFLELQDNTEKLDAVLEGLNKQKSLSLDGIETVKGAKGDKGDQGIQGEKGIQGERGERGNDGEDSTIPGPKGDIGPRGFKGDDGSNGKDGKDGSPDTPEQIAEKLNTLEGVLDISVIKGSLTIDQVKNQFDTWNQPAKGRLDQRWHGGGLTQVYHDTTLTGTGSASNPLSVTVAENYLSKITANDTTPNYLTNKITVSGGLVKSITNPGGNEAYNIDGSAFLTTVTAGTTYVPYTGATADLNLGTHAITTTGTGSFGVGTFSGNVQVGPTSTYAYRMLVSEAGITPEDSTTINTDALKAHTFSLQGDGAAYFMGRDVTNNIEFIMGTSSTGAAFAGSVTAHNFQLRTGNNISWTILYATGALVSGSDGTSAYKITTAGTGSFGSVNLTSVATPTATAGTVFFNGTNFFGYNGSVWKQLDN